MKIQTQKYIFDFSYLLIVSFVFFSCAQIVQPGGGPKDIKPPRVLKYYPDSAATNFKAKEIKIEFNKFIQLSDLQKQLFISPPMHTMPDVQTKGKILVIELKDSLRKNTTYVLNFGKSIRDYTEGNIAENFQYIFSTGSYIDTLKLSGVVKNAFDMKAESDVLVMIYDASTTLSTGLFDDSVPYKKVPSYFARTNADGSYTISNIRAGTYKVFALKDINANYLYDSPEESIAFSDSLVTIKKNTKLDLTLFKEEAKKQKLLKASVAEHGHLMFAFTKSTNDSLKLNFFSQEPKENVIYEYSQNKDTLHYWFTDDLKDTMKIQLVQGEKILDTVRIKPITLEQVKTIKRGNKWGLTVKTNVSKDKLFDLKKNIVLKFNHPVPIASELVSNISLTSKLKKPLSCKDTVVSKLGSKYTKAWASSCVLEGDSLYSLFVPPGTFTDIFGLTNDTIKSDFKTQEENFYGTLKLTLKMKIRIKSILQLMNEKGEIFNYSSSAKGVFTYTYLPPGAYTLRIIYDRNGDDKWTTGNYLENRKPETVIYYSGAITIRSNWDLELEWAP